MHEKILLWIQWLQRFQSLTILHLVRKISYIVFCCYLCTALMGFSHTSLEPTLPYVIQQKGSHRPRASYLVLHYTACNFKKSLQVLTSPKSSVSTHYLVPTGPINRKRSVYQLVSESDRAWCQGISAWQGNSDLNSTGISIEIVNTTRKNKKGILCFKPYPAYQIDTVAILSQDIISRYNIDPTHVVGHSDICPYRKTDPGPLFPWEKLHKVYGIGAWPNEADVRYYKTFLSTYPNLYSILYNLVLYGYPIKLEDSQEDKKTQWNEIINVVSAFQMHFRQSLYDGYIDKETAAIIHALVKKYRSKVALEPNTCAMLKHLAKQLDPFYKKTRRNIKK